MRRCIGKPNRIEHASGMNVLVFREHEYSRV